MHALCSVVVAENNKSQFVCMNDCNIDHKDMRITGGGALRSVLCGMA
jgi:hypothetical protein